VKKVLIVGGVILVLFIAACGFGGYSLLRSFQDSAKSLGPEFERSKRNGIPLTLDAMRPERAIAPGENAALEYKKAFDIWQEKRSMIDDARWESYISSQEQNDDTVGVESIIGEIAGPIEAGAKLAEAQWQIDYSDRAFGSHPVFVGVVDGVFVWRRMIQGSESEQLAKGMRVSDHVVESHDPGSLRAASAIRMELLQGLALKLPFIEPSQYQVIRSSLDQVEAIDPVPVWRTTAFLQFATWDNYENLSQDQKTLFGGARRDDGVMLDAASTEILKFWNTAIEAADGKPELIQYTTLGEMVLRLRERTDLAAVPLKQLWTLDSATKGAGSLDWILANEQLMIMKQALDILTSSKGAFPEKFDCKRVSVIGMKAYTYERTKTGFKLSAKPSDVLAPQSALAKQSLVYEFKAVK